MSDSIPLKPANVIRILLAGDVVGKPGLKIACMALPWLRQRAHVDVCIVNAENAADGTGLRANEYKRLMDAGFDAVTLGDHIYKKREIIEILGSQPNIVKPANFPPNSPGKSWCVVETPLGKIAIFSLLGRVFMRPVDCPLLAADRVLSEIPSEIRMKIVDVHAEATSDKQVIGRYLDGRVSAVLGTHTHVATADEQILPKGTGFQCDVGMTGAFESILGRRIDAVVATTLTFDPNAFHVATEDVRFSATWVDVSPQTGLSVGIGRIQWKEGLLLRWEREKSELTRRL